MTAVSEEGEILETHAVVKVDPIVVPAVNPEQALAAWKAYEALKAKITTEDDYQNIQGKRFPKKSVWRKLTNFFNLTVDQVEERRVREEDGTLTFEVIYRATAPNGRSAVGDGACNTEEKQDRNGNPIRNSIHNTRGTAHTRAFNRAVSNLVGGGEVSAEEVGDDYQAPPTQRPQAPIDASKLEFFVMNIPKNKNQGKTLEQIGFQNVTNDYTYWSARIAKEGKPATGAVKDFLDHAAAWLEAQKNKTKSTHKDHEDHGNPYAIQEDEFPKF